MSLNRNQKFPFLQINLQHSKAASAILCRQLNMGHTYAALIQEPYSYKGAVRGICETNNGKLFYKFSEANPRSCIFVKNNVIARPLTKFCSRDLVAVSIEMNLGGTKRDVVVCSAYLPYDSSSPPPTPELTELVEYCRRNNRDLIIGSDVNAHHTTWGSTDINDRGRALLEYLFTTDLVTLNQGNEPTFVTARRAEVLDVTLCNSRLSKYVEQWRVSSEPSLSDHRHILFNINSAGEDRAQYRNPKSTDWDSYKEALTARLKDLPGRLTTAEDVEIAVSILQRCLLTSYEESCPLRRPSDRRKTPWWDHSLEKLRRETRRLFNKARRSNTPASWDSYKQSQREYKAAVRKNKTMAWRNYCQNLESLPEAARIQKVLAKDPRSKLITLKLPSGDCTSNEKEMIQALYKAHFPSAKLITDTDAAWAHDTRTTRHDWELAKQIVTVNRIKWAINQFAPYKSAGEDGIFPALLQKGLEVLGIPLCSIFRACISLGYTPEAWRIAKVVYIPKPGRTSYAEAKSFRPISLTSFLLKTLERLIDRHIRDDVLKDSPLQTNQHAYQAGKSVETALHDLVYKIEGTLEHKQLAQGIFIDIEGAFDNATYESMYKAVEKRGTKSTLVRWIRLMLQHRILKTTLSNECIIMEAGKGCPQGGVLSPLLWCLVIDSLISKLNSLGIYAQGYADDLVVLIRGAFPATISEVSQRALNTVAAWCIEHNLTVNPMKTKVVLFTRRRNLEGYSSPTFAGQILERTGAVKYLGVILDCKLTWKLHVENRVQKAIAVFWACRRTFGKTWGLKPRITYWIYKAMIRSIITYAAIVWWPRTRLEEAKRRLTQVQRLACLGITGAMRTTPTAALESLLDLPPLYLVVESEAKAAAYRLANAGQWKHADVKGGHSAIWQKLISFCPTALMRSDKMVPKHVFDKSFAIQTPTREEWLENKEMLQKFNGLIWYTDGSKMEEATAASIYGQSPKTKLRFPLGEFATVFQAEIYAILACAGENIKRAYTNKRIVIFTDSLAALKALDQPKVTSRLVWNCLEVLEELAQLNSLVLRWVPAHSEIEGNEVADDLAKLGLQDPFYGPEPAFGISSKSAKFQIQTRVRVDHERVWKFKRAGMSRLFIKGPSQASTEGLLQLSRNQLRAVAGILTGHWHLNRHLTTIGVRNNATCERCLEDDETSLHVLCQCAALATLRQKYFGNGNPEPKDIMETSLNRLLNYLSESGCLSNES